MCVDSNKRKYRPECGKCFGLCCVALYFSVYDGFPEDKRAGVPCGHLGEDFRCGVHSELAAIGLKGCVAYECFGAGQQVSQVTFAGCDWRQNPASAGPMFEAFLIMRRLHELCWYLGEALTLERAATVHEEIEEALRETGRIAELAPRALAGFDIAPHCAKVDALLGRVSGLERNETGGASKDKRKVFGDFFGKDLRKRDLRDAELRGACLIAANMEEMDLSGADLIGADLRDANIKGANLSTSIFLTQFQVNAANGDAETKLPPALSRPTHWK